MMPICCSCWMVNVQVLIGFFVFFFLFYFILFDSTNTPWSWQCSSVQQLFKCSLIISLTSNSNVPCVKQTLIMTCMYSLSLVCLQFPLLKSSTLFRHFVSFTFPKSTFIAFPSGSVKGDEEPLQKNESF